MDVENFKVAIIGAGPSGGILGAYLTKKNVNVTLVDIWKDHMEAIQRDGLQITGVSTHNVHFDADHLKTSILDLKDVKPNLVFVSVKTPFLDRVAQDLKKVVPDDAFIISHQNGIGTEEFLAETFGKERAGRIVINYAGNIIEPGKIDMTFFNPPNFIGAISSESNALAKSIADLMSETGLTTEFQEDIRPAVWKKCILNASLAGLCAVTHMTMKEAMDYEDTYEICSNLLKEGIAVADAIGITFGEDFYDLCMGYLSKGGHHKPSMLCDVEAGKPTEITFLNEQIVKVGKQHNIPVPFNEAVTSVIKGIDFLTHKNTQYIRTKGKEMGLADRCYDCSHVKDCIDIFDYCPLSGDEIPSKTPRPKFSEITLEEHEDIAIIRINRPPANQLSINAFKELRRAAELIAKNENTKAVILGATGSKYFAAGIDLKEVCDENIHIISDTGRNAFRAIESLEIPTIAAINGYALGAGCELILAADIRIASANAKFGQPEVKLGIIPGAGGTQRLTRLLGLARASELILTGDIIDAERALDWGLISKIVPADELESTALSIAKKILKNAPIAVREAKRAIKMADRVMDLDAGLDFETRLFDQVFQCEDREEGVQAFIEKRDPKFKGK
ncbi:MAG: 2-dehydropantoate 2-reductase [Candidatus Hermodarchaeota archaeon]